MMAEQDDSQAPKKHLVRAADWQGKYDARLSHPLNEASDVFWLSLSEKVGMARAHLSVITLPPGKESFAYHFHRVQEEFIFVLSGEGQADIGDQVFDVGPGDYMGFPTDGTGHHLRNTGTDNLVYLVGGERTSHEIAHFPRHGKVLVADAGTPLMADKEAFSAMEMSDWVVKENLDGNS